MAIPSLFQSRVVSKAQPYYSDGDFDVTSNPLGALRVVQALPPDAELARFGGTWTVSIATGSAFAPVAAMPTTLANLVLHNSDPRKTYIIDTITGTQITSHAAATQFTLLCQVVAGATAPTDDTNQLIWGLTGQSSYPGRAKRAVAQSTMIANKWLSVASIGGLASASIGSGCVAFINGKIQLPPGAMLGVNLIAGTAAGTAIQGITWHEVELPTL